MAFRLKLCHLLAVFSVIVVFSCFAYFGDRGGGGGNSNEKYLLFESAFSTQFVYYVDIVWTLLL